LGGGKKSGILGRVKGACRELGGAEKNYGLGIAHPYDWTYTKLVGKITYFRS